ncbi:MAG: cupin domain-containing protein [Candidatus Woesearchaeota archaeon]|jgi:mannose-6-phosphate isomerase-like protein (cupin superfamily)
MRKHFKKHLKDINLEEAHGGSGKRQLILSKEDPVSTQLHAMTKGFLEPGNIFDWHNHEKIDEFFLIIEGEGKVYFEDGTEINYKKDDLIYVPAEEKHKIENTGSITSEFFFIRINE